MKGFFSGLHMTAIWGYCVFWPERVVYDRWQERKSRAAGLNTDMQIAFSWLPYSAWYLSRGLQYASLFTARKQLINSTKAAEERELMFFLCWVKVETPQVASEHCKIKCILSRILFYHSKRDKHPENTDVSRWPQNPHRHWFVWKPNRQRTHFTIQAYKWLQNWNLQWLILWHIRWFQSSIIMLMNVRPIFTLP